jgi:hypothetical protein
MAQHIKASSINRNSIIFLLLSILAPLSCTAVSIVESHQKNDEPWYTGPLLTPSARVIPVGHLNLEPYLFHNVSTGSYDKNWEAHSTPTFNQVIFQIHAKTGIFKNFDITISPQSIYSYSQGRHASSFGDLPIGIAYQLYEGKPEDWLTYVKIGITEIFPTGKYDHLNEDLLFSDVGGQGRYLTNIHLTVSKLVNLHNHRYFSWRCNLTATIPSTASIRGKSIYGGGEETRGAIQSRISCLFLAGAEYTFTKEISLACDFQVFYSPKGHFKGFTVIPVRDPESVVFGLAPAIEYNWNSNIGVIIGCWFSFAGKNANRFVNGVAAFNYSY